MFGFYTHKILVEGVVPVLWQVGKTQWGTDIVLVYRTDTDKCGEKLNLPIGAISNNIFLTKITTEVALEIKSIINEARMNIDIN